ncbi:MAG: UPF0147 family protein [Candidatus Aenigmarchaeota archaeon]|jgi:hypothetical protein|nr:UPF0147 family protein [Candidatus Aenigmarchaeota archaeon]
MKNLEPIIKLLNGIIEDRTVPRNIRAAAEEAKKELTEKTDNNWDIRLSSAISVLDEIINDPNMPIYTRTQIWNVVSMLEAVKREL